MTFLSILAFYAATLAHAGGAAACPRVIGAADTTMNLWLRSVLFNTTLDLRLRLPWASLGLLHIFRAADDVLTWLLISTSLNILGALRISLPIILTRCIFLRPLSNVASLFHVAGAALNIIVAAIDCRRPLGLVALYFLTPAGFRGVGQGALGILALYVAHITRWVIGVGKPLAYTLRVTLAAPMRNGARCVGMAIIGALQLRAMLWSCTVGAWVALGSMTTAVVPLFLQRPVTLAVAVVVVTNILIAVHHPRADVRGCGASSWRRGNGRCAGHCKSAGDDGGGNQSPPRGGYASGRS